MTDGFYVDTTALRNGANRWGDIAEIIEVSRSSLGYPSLSSLRLRVNRVVEERSPLRRIHFIEAYGSSRPQVTHNDLHLLTDLTILSHDFFGQHAWIQFDEAHLVETNDPSR